MKHLQIIIVLSLVAVLLTACDRLWMDTSWRSERYVAISIDTRSQMSLSFDTRRGDAVALVGPTVFAIGADQKYIVTKQHPADPAVMSFDRAITNYFIIERSKSPDLIERTKRVRGPLKKEEFERLAAALSLPQFTKIFDDLK